MSRHLALLLAALSCAACAASPPMVTRPGGALPLAAVAPADDAVASAPRVAATSVAPTAAPAPVSDQEVASRAVGGASRVVDEPAALSTDQPIDDDVDDETETEAAADDAPAPAAAASPLLALSDGEIKRRLRSDPDSLGPLSVGRCSAGRLVNGVRLPKSALWVRMDPGRTWGTQETIDYLQAAFDKVREEFPNVPKAYVGHLSARRGGHLSPHKSHQSGRDVDVSYYLEGTRQHRWYRRAHAKNLDRARSWALVRALLTETDVQYIFINTSVQKLLKEYALSIGEDPEWLDSVFQYGSKQRRPIIRHARGHDTHIHVRFYNPVAQELGRRAYRALVDLGRIKPPTYYVRHRARKGDTLGQLARRYGTTVRAIQKANGLRGTRILAKRTYKIPKQGGVRYARKPMRIPARRLPPAAGTSAKHKAAP